MTTAEQEKETQTKLGEDEENTQTKSQPVAEKTAPPAESKQKEEEESGSSQREYVVLRVWEIEAVKMASSGEAAIRSIGEEVLVGGHTYVAIPSRSWNPITVEIERTTTMKLTPK